ncbi:uncharacterized protein LOC142220253 [Haematobia irritans]|uniref:uncharacterized protein LOC142220253 n=1 Tax=Haematobia irritans TaxID=7368 RepID=UPI003F4F4ECE
MSPKMMMSMVGTKTNQTHNKNNNSGKKPNSSVGKISSTKAMKLQRNNNKGVVPPARASISASASLSSLCTSGSLTVAAAAASSVAAATLLTSNIVDSSLFNDVGYEKKKRQHEGLMATQTLLQNTTTTAATPKMANEIAFLGSLKDNNNTITIDNDNNNNNIASITRSSSNNNNNNKVFSSRTMPSFKILSYQNIFALLTVLVCGLVSVNGLKCHMCGQYNEGVGSITPCLNYSDQYAHLYLKECSKKSEKYCVKYVSELSTVRDCATECAEKEIWETQTYCCTEDGCNGASAHDISSLVLMVPLMVYICQAIWMVIKERR